MSSDNLFVIKYLKYLKEEEYDSPTKEETTRFDMIIRKFPKYKKYFTFLPLKEVKKIMSTKSTLTKQDLEQFKKKEQVKNCKLMVKKYSKKKKIGDLKKYKSLKKRFDTCQETIKQSH